MQSDPRLGTNLKGFPNRVSYNYGERSALATNNVLTISIYNRLIMPLTVSQLDSPRKCSFYFIEKIYELLKDFMKHNVLK